MKKMSFFKILIIGLSVISIATSCKEKKKDYKQSMSIGGKEYKLEGGCLYRYLSPSNPDAKVNEDNFDNTNSLSITELIFYSLEVELNQRTVVVESRALNEINVYYEFEPLLKEYKIDTIIDFDENNEMVTEIVSVPIYDTIKYFYKTGSMIRLTLISSSISGIVPGKYTYDAEANIDKYSPQKVTDDSRFFVNYDFDKSKGENSGFAEGTVNVISINSKNNEIEVEFNLKTETGVTIEGQYQGKLTTINEYEKAVKRGEYDSEDDDNSDEYDYFDLF